MNESNILSPRSRGIFSVCTPKIKAYNLTYNLFLETMTTRKNILMFLLIAVFLGGLAFLGYSMIKAKDPVIVDGSTKSETYLEQTRVEVEVGTVKVMHSSGEQETVVKTLPLLANDTITSSADAKATIYWPDGSLSRIKGESNIEIAQVTVSENNFDIQVDATIHKGEVWTKVLNMLTENSEVTLRTQNTVAGIRGTVVYHHVTDTLEEVVPLEHVIDLKTSDTSYTLIENQGVTIKDKVSTKFDITAEESDRIKKDNLSADANYLKGLSAKRRALFEKDRSKISLDLAGEQFGKYVNKDTLTSSLKNTLALTELDRLMSEIAERHGANDETKVIELLGKFDDAVKSLKDSYKTDGDKIINDRLSLYAKILFPGDIDSMQLLIRQNMFQKKIEITKSLGEDDVVKSLTEKELFFANDLAKAGKIDQSKAVMKQLSSVKQLDTPIFHETSDDVIYNELKVRMNKIDPTLNTPLQEIRTKLYDVTKDAFSPLRDAVTNQDVKLSATTFIGLPDDQKPVALSTIPNIKDILLKANDPRLSEFLKDEKPPVTDTIVKPLVPTTTLNRLVPKTTTTTISPLKTTTTTTIKPTTTTTTTIKPTTTTTIKPIGTEGYVAPRPTYRGTVTPPK